MLDRLRSHLVFAFRSLRQRPSFALLVISVLGVGLGCEHRNLQPD